MRRRGKKLRKIPVSAETAYRVSRSPKKRIEIYSFFPVDKGNCACVQMIRDWKRKLGEAKEKDRRFYLEQTEFLVCPRDKTNMQRYKITCQNCGQIMGWCWATDETLRDWCDFHYAQWTDGESWYGCFTPHVSPVSEQLCFECTCGQDTRDFRPNVLLPSRKSLNLERRNAIGRDLGQPNSKFKANVVG